MVSSLLHGRLRSGGLWFQASPDIPISMEEMLGIVMYACNPGNVGKLKIV
jgi:hypothetical protein